MAEPLSALSVHLMVLPPANAMITLNEVNPFSLTQIAAWPDSIAKAAA